MRDERDLLAAWAQGDAAAGQALYEQHFEAVFRFFRNKAGDALEDLLQSTFLHCLEARASFRGESSFRTYLFTIARHELYAHYRARGRRADEVEVGTLSIEDLGASPSSVVADRRERALLARALRKIPLDQQVALELHYWEELTGPELAEVLGVPEGTVRSRLRRAREALEAQMSALAGDESELLRSSLADLEGWAASLKATVSR